MSTLHFKETTTSTPEQFVAGLTDFGPGRTKLFQQQRRRLPQGASSRAPARPTSRRARAASGNACTTTGPIPTTSSSRPPTPTCGEATRATPTTSPAQPDGTTDVDAVSRTRGQEPQGTGARGRARNRRRSAAWRRRSTRPSRPSKPGTTSRGRRSPPNATVHHAELGARGIERFCDGDRRQPLRCSGTALASRHVAAGPFSQSSAAVTGWGWTRARLTSSP